MDGHRLHRRKSSKDEDENIVLITRPMDLEPTPDDVPLVSAPPPPRNRVQSSPGHSHTRSVSSVGMGPSPPSAGPFRTGFNMPRPPNGITAHPASPFRQSFAPPSPTHSRTRSISSSAFSPSVHSPLASSFSFPQQAPSSLASQSPTLYAFPASHSAPDASSSSSSSQPPNKPSSRRHARLHSRNLSVFFPRPGSLPQSSISEDGAQELEILVDEEAPAPAPISTIPSAKPSLSLPNARTPLGAGFTFGGRAPESEGVPAPEMMRREGSTEGRRGHHHKHSMSHSFFSFLEPGAGAPSSAGVGAGEEGLHTQPTPMPMSPWAPISAFPQSATGTGAGAGFPPHTPVTSNGHHHHRHQEEEEQVQDAPNQRGALAVGLAQFILGAWLWVSGQQIGSLSTTGLGYWVVFDAFGVGLGGVVPRWLQGQGPNTDGGKKSSIRRSYGNAPVQTVLMFAQAVYLMFSSVYVCKETVEHLLLSAGGNGGGAEGGHHHHRGDEDDLGVVGIEFPIVLAFLTILSLLGTALLYDNHAKLLDVTGSRIPSLRTLIRSLGRSGSKMRDSQEVGRTGVMGNPYVVSPLVFAGCIVLVGVCVPGTHHRTCDLLLAGLITVVTFNLAYRACTVLGSVLLMTAPARGAKGGRMEAFLRAMREVERHPQVLHLPAPHMWQLAPASSSSSPSSPPSSSSSNGKGGGAALVVTLELHVRQDLGDGEVLELTRWAWEKCAAALDGGGRGGGGGMEVTVGVVRG
ncbi:hypothetical protein FPV67DRAFT_1419729 [Lyophyllum atratum]|nr:hypothetical protein FPV67DRAFT_1419729 [Lyophyllum atratum]